MNNDIQILLVDDHQVVRDGLQHMLGQEEGMKVVGQGASGEEALAQIDKLSPNIVLMDIKMPGVDGIELARQVRQEYPTCNVIMLTLYDQYLLQAIEAGAKGYLLKDIQRDELIQAIKRVHEGRLVISESIKSKTQLQFEYEESRETRPRDKQESQDKKTEELLAAVAEKIPDTKSEEDSGVMIEKSQDKKSEESLATMVEEIQDKAEESLTTMVEEVQLVLPPPVEANQMMRFVSQAEEILHSRVLEVIGSWQEGTIITLILPIAISFRDILGKFKGMSEIEEVAEKMPNGDINPKLLKNAEAIPRLKNRTRKTIFVTLEKCKN